MTLRTMRHLSVASFVLASVLAAPTALATSDADSGAGAGHARMAKVVEARSSFEKGLKLFDEGKFAPARDSFQHAYDLAPSYRLLYNIGLANKELGDYAGAIRALEGYLAEGTWEITTERGTEIAGLLSDLIHKVGTSKITTNVPGAQLFVDGAFAGQAPLDEPLALNPGKHTIEARAKGYTPASKSVSAAPGEAGEDVHLELGQPGAGGPSTGMIVAVSAVVIVGIGALVMRKRRPEGASEAAPAKATTKAATKTKGEEAETSE